MGGKPAGGGGILNCGRPAGATGTVGATGAVAGAPASNDASNDCSCSSNDLSVVSSNAAGAPGAVGATASDSSS